VYAKAMPSLESHSDKIIGHDTTIATPYGKFPLVYADWAASGRLYEPIEKKMQTFFGPFVANTHTESNATGTAMTQAYHEAKHILKHHVGASKDDALIFAGSGMTGAVTLLQRILGWKVPESFQSELKLNEEDTPIVFVSELEHHSNHTTWIETIADVVVVPQTKTETVDTQKLRDLLVDYKNRRFKVAAMSAGSNVTGARTDVHEIASIMHDAGGLCFVDYTCAAPYDSINMHPANRASLDAIYFSPHKFLGGPGAPGVLVLNKGLYKNAAPDRPGGGTVLWTNPWGGRQYYDDIETREDGGTPPFLGAIRAALTVKLKEKMGMKNIADREEAIVNQVFSELGSAEKVRILDPNRKNRLAVFAFTIEGLHYNLVTRLLNDRFGIQVRGGCACAGTYGHVLFGIDQKQSQAITAHINDGDFSTKPGFVRVSFNPTMSDETITYVTAAIKEIALRGDEWAKSYEYDSATNEFRNTEHVQPVNLSINEGFTL
jgi:selenocysteine lyase/cysteine desulfurase